jgi:hypothetical protein
MQTNSDDVVAVTSEVSSEVPQAPPSAVDLLVQTGIDMFELMHDEMGQPLACARDRRDGLVRRLGSREFRYALARGHKEKVGKYPTARAIDGAVEVLQSEAVLEGVEVNPALRIAEVEDGLRMRLSDHHIARISASGWSVSRHSSAFFLAREAMHDLPDPEPGGDVRELREFLNVSEEDQFKLVVGWLLCALRPRGPYPILVLEGQQGSAKSTATRMLRSLIDPASAPIRSMSSNLRDLMVMGQNNYVLAFDNLSGIRPDISDGLCRLATGGGFGARTHYTMDEETVFDQQRPIIMNGIESIATRQDLLDRCLVVRLQPPAEYKEERTLVAEFDAARPRILGALMDAAVASFAGVDRVKLDDAPRLVDAVKWVTAAEEHLGWTRGAFMDAYTSSRRDELSASLDGSLVVRPIEMLLEMSEDDWTGTPTQLYDALSVHSNATRPGRRWPANAQVLSRHLTLITAALATQGIHIESGFAGRGSDKIRLVTIRRINGTQGTQGTQEVNAS